MISVLYVDDEPDLLEIGKLFLEQSGQFHIDTAISATDALTTMQSKVYDAIISDYQMPGMDGIEFLKNVRASGNTIPFIIFTGKGREEIVIQALNEGADFYIQKGGDPEPQFAELRHKVRMAVLRRTAEASLAKGQEQHLEILQTAMDGYMLLDTKGNILEVNKAYSLMSGYSQQELLLMSVSDLKAAESTEDPASHIRSIVNEGKARFESHHRRKDGSTFYLEINAHYHPAEGGRIIAFLNDITERKQAEETLNETNKRLSFALRSAKAGTWDWDFPTGKLVWSPEFFELFGISPEVTPSFDAWLDHLHPDDRTMALEKTNQSVAEHRDLWNEYRVVLPDGTILWIGASGSTTYNDSGEPLRMSGVCIDITERKLAELEVLQKTEQLNSAYEEQLSGEEELRQNYKELALSQRAVEESEKRYRSLFENMLNGVAYCQMIYDDQGRPENFVYLVVNDAFETLTGLKNVVGKKVTEVIPGIKELTPELFEIYGRVARTGEAETFEIDFKPLDTFLHLSVFSMETGYFIAVFEDVTERKRAEVKLRESEEKYRTMFTMAADGIIVHDTKGRNIDVNEQACGMLGYSRDELLAMRVSDLVQPEELQQNPPRLAEALAGLPVCYERKLRRKDGTLLDVEIRASRVREGMVQAFWRDITERKRVGEGLKESEEVHRSILHTAMDGFVMLDGNGNLIEANETYSRMSGYSVQELLTMSINDLEAAESAADTTSHIGRIIQKGEDRFLSKHRRKDGSTYDIESSVQYKPDSGGRFIVFIRDITREKQAEEDILKANRMKEESLVLFKTLNEHAPVGFAFMDRHYRFVHINETLAEINGFSVQEHLGRTPEELLPEIWPVIKQVYEKVLDTGTPVMNIEITGKVPSNPERTRHWIGNYYPVRTADQNVAGIGVIVIDITERKQAEEEVRLNEARLESLLRINQHPAENIQELLDYALEEAIALTGSKIGYIYFYNDVKSEFTLNTWSRDVMQQCTVNEPETQYQLEKTGIWGEVVRQGRPIVVNDFMAPNPLKKGLPEGHAPLYKYLTIPVITEGHIVAVVGVANKLTDYNDSDVRQLNLMMDAVWKLVQRKRAEDALQQANRRLTLLGSITRHDISNQLSVLNGFLKLLHKKNSDEALEDYFTKITKASSCISSMIQFTREYEEIGVRAPVWQDCRTLVDNAAKETPLGNVSLINDLAGGAELFADPLIVKVFFNLIDNAVRYGGTITTIKISIEESGDGHLLIFEDNGIGIPEDEKEKIFERGYGKNTGLGLYLSREILSITGIAIHETGKPGKGARFEINVPEESYRTRA